MEMIERALWIVRLLLISSSADWLRPTTQSVTWGATRRFRPAYPGRGGVPDRPTYGWGGGCQAELVERNLRLVVYIARKFESTGVGVEDLVSIGTMA